MDEKQKVIQNVKEALALLESHPPMVALMPEVRMNIAMALKNASNPMEVAAVPGRLIPLHGKVTAVSDPEFGASHHLASILLMTGNKAVINIKYTGEVLSSLKTLSFSYTDSPETPADILIDKGGFGIEPCAYIFGRDAVDAALKVLKIAEIL
jgi:predicted fused transcriptional regulator/phosphomethylpyrimidine kinase